MNASEFPNRSKAEEFEKLLRCYGDMAYRMALHLTAGQETEARDLVQEGFLKVWRHWNFERPGSFKGWMYRLLHNLYMDVLRRRARRPTFSLDADADALWEEALAEKSPGAPETLEQKELQGQVAGALRRLDLEFRIPVVLCDMEGLSYEEIARTLGVPIGTVRSRIHRGRCQLRRALVHL